MYIIIEKWSTQNFTGIIRPEVQLENKVYAGIMKTIKL